MNTRIQPVSNPTNTVQAMFEAIKSKLGSVPNMFKTLAQSPAMLEGYLNFTGALSKGKLSGQLREQLALTVAGANDCEYCASAHTAIGKMVKIEESELRQNLAGKSGNAKTQAALTFAKRVVETKGHVLDADLKAVRDAGYDDGDIAEIVGAVSVNILTNYFNSVAATSIDFPVVSTANIKQVG